MRDGGRTIEKRKDAHINNRYAPKVMIKRFFTHLVIIAVAASMLISLSGCGSEKRPESEIVREICLTYGRYGKQADSRISELLKELRTVNKEDADKWKRIVSLWASVDEGIAINYDVLPDGLPDSDELCIVALGFQLNADGSMKDELIDRLKVVLSCAEKYPNALIVCTGGGTAANAPEATEAGCMAQWLEEHGISHERIIVENKSMTTAQNASYTCSIISEKYPKISCLAIVSSDYHIGTGTLFFGAELILTEKNGRPSASVVSNAACRAQSGSLSRMFQAGGLIELAGDTDTAYKVYYDTYDIHELPDLN